MFVLVVGGGKVGYYLAKELIESGHEVALMEKDPSARAQIADEIGSIVIAARRVRGQVPRRGRLRTAPTSSRRSPATTRTTS